MRRPLQVITPGIEGDVLAALWRADAAMTPPRLFRVINRGSLNSVRRAASRLAEQGVLIQEQTGKAYTYRFNREHLAAEAIGALANMRERFFGTLRDEIGRWPIKPELALVFGSVARGDARADSDIDLLIVRPGGLEPEDEQWGTQLSELTNLAWRLTGNDPRVIQVDAEEVQASPEEPYLLAAAEEGVELFGSTTQLKRWMKTGVGS